MSDEFTYDPFWDFSDEIDSSQFCVEDVNITIDNMIELLCGKMLVPVTANEWESLGRWS